MKIKKRKKESRMHGRKMGTHGGGARKKRKGSGHRGGVGMSGTGKRADHKKTLVTKKYGHGYFGKKGVTSRGTKRDKGNIINLFQIQGNLEKYGKKTAKGWEINLENYKILGKGEVKEKLIINAKQASKLAIELVKKSGGEIVLPVKKRRGKKEKLEDAEQKGKKKEVKKKETKVE
jgi:large subunit ribosomal protein L15